MALKFRRGTTAQQSGSLAFGEPYVNTTLGTLLVGGDTGDIQLATAGTSSTATFGPISGSGLDITGNANIHGNLTLGGNISIGDQTSDVVNVVASLSSSLIPSQTNTFDLGSASRIWRDLYISTGSIKIVDPGTNSVVGTLTSNGSGDLNVGGAISASSISGFGNASSYSSSVASRVNTIETTYATSASIASATATSISNLSSSVKAVTDLHPTSASVATATANSISALSSSVKAVTDLHPTSASVASATATSISSLSSSVKAVTDTFATSASVASATATSISTLSGSVKAVTDTLDGKITTEKGRIDAILTASTADADTFAEIVTLINSVDLTNDTAFASFYTASVGRLNSLESATGSYAISSSVASATATSISSLSSSVAASGFAVSSSVATATATSIGALSSSVKAVTDTFATSASVASATADSISTLSSSIYQTDVTQSSNVTTISSSLASRVNTIETTYATSASIASATATSISSLSSSVKAVTDTFATSASVASATATSISTLSASIATRDINQDTTTTNISTSVASRINTIETTYATSASIASATATSISSLSSSVAAVGYAVKNADNIFTGNQTVTGSVYVSGDFIVQGTSSLQNITASAASIGTNIVILNTATPAVRFGGISVIDSGSGATTGSLLWDSTNNRWLYSQPSGSGAPYNSAILINGPENSGSLGSELTLTATYIPVAQAGDHIKNSQITDDGTTVTIPGTLTVSTAITGYATSASVASATATSISSLSSSVKAVTDTFATSASVASANSSAINTLSSSVKAVTDTFATSASVAAADAASISTLSGSVKAVTDSLGGRVTTLEGKDISITLTGDVTGTGTITDLANVSFATTIAANSVALGTDTTGDYVASLVAGTGVTITNNSGEGATPTIAIGQAVATSSSPTFAGLTINGAITATGDITAYYTSDRRHKNNIKTITNALAKVIKLNGVTWEWNDDVNEVTKQTPKTGLIAQEVQEVLPEVIKEREDGFLSLDYSKMTGLLVEAIKEQQQQIHKLTLEIEILKKQKGL